MNLFPFVGVAAVVIVTPGVDMALVTRNGLLSGRRAAVGAAVGITVGNLFWTAAASLGLAAIVAASAAAFTVVKVAGALFLVYLGLKALRHAGQPLQLSGQPAADRGLSTGLRQGVISNLLNPKIAVFFTSLLPQFVGADPTAPELLGLGALFSFMGLLWLCVYALVVSRGRNVLARPGIKRALDRITGLVLVGLGVRLALERRPA
jgi:threonine/homoserine/homoserine lactone efflux protein